MGPYRTAQRILTYKHLGQRNVELFRRIKDDSYHAIMVYWPILELMMMDLKNCINVRTFCL